MQTAIRDWNEYLSVRRFAQTEPDRFWAQVAEETLFWRSKWTQVSNCHFEKGQVRWYLDGKLNVSENCLDRHVQAGLGDHLALIWIGNDPDQKRVFTYRELHRQVCQVACTLKNSGISKGDRVVFYLPNIPELAIGMLACARIGAVHSVIFGGYAPHSIHSRILDCSAKLIFTADESKRGEKQIDLKKNVEEALQMGCPSVEKVIVVPKAGGPRNGAAREVGAKEITWENWINQGTSSSGFNLDCEAFDSEDPLFILYTSGSTGKPKGVLHASGGYLTYAAYTLKTVFQTQPQDVFWCTADLGWITAHSYLLYGPLCLGLTTVMYEGIPTYPHPGRFWEIIDEHRVNVLYTSPTAIRTLASHGAESVQKYSRKSLRVLGSVGEPISAETWNWYSRVVGGGKLPIVDTWWQTETGGILISPIAGVTPTPPGSATHPLPGIETELREGQLLLNRSWPGQMVGVYGDPNRFYQTYFTGFKGFYWTGDRASLDADGNIWIQGRVDDVIKVSGHRIGSAELESAAIEHPQVVEAAAIGVPHEKTGEAIYLFVVLRDSSQNASGPTQSDLARADLDQLEKEVVKTVRSCVGPVATPSRVIFVPGLPKTRSGKIMRRLLRKLTEETTTPAHQLGDVSALADPEIMNGIAKAYQEQSLSH